MKKDSLLPFAIVFAALIIGVSIIVVAIINTKEVGTPIKESTQSEKTTTEICLIDKSNFSIDWIGINATYTLIKDTELRAQPIIKDCNILDIVPSGTTIILQTETNGAVNATDPLIWLKIFYNNQEGWIRGDYLDDRFKR